MIRFHLSQSSNAPYVMQCAVSQCFSWQHDTVDMNSAGQLHVREGVADVLNGMNAYSVHNVAWLCRIVVSNKLNCYIEFIVIAANA